MWDRIAVLAIYIPILREEVHKFARIWNMHTIRKQNNRPHSVSGKPYMLYNYPKEPATNYGIRPDEDFLHNLKAEIADWGKYSFSI
jgi:hypothetical protein